MSYWNILGEKQATDIHIIIDNIQQIADAVQKGL